MNEKLIFMEYEKQAEANKQLAEMGQSNKVQELRTQIEKHQDANVRRIVDLQKLRKCLNRLKNDLYVYKLSKKLQKESLRERAGSHTAQTLADEDELLQATNTSTGLPSDANNVSKGSNSGIAEQKTNNVVDSDKMVSE